ncbi:MAG: dihydrofolate reductase family protein [Candidatus Amoebophilus sp.]
MSQQSKAIVFVAVSLDGFIAKQDGDIGWLSLVDRPNEDYGYSAFMQGIGAVIMGRKTYDKVLSLGENFLHKDKQCYVLSTKQHKSNYNHITFYQGELTKLVEELKSKFSKGLYIEGGGEVISELRKDHLIDEYIISIIPILLGSGIPLFKACNVEEKLELSSAKAYPSGLVQVHYQVHYSNIV